MANRAQPLHGEIVNERRVLDLIEQECRRGLVPLKTCGPNTLLGRALRRAALQIAREAEADSRSAARTASMVGFAVTRGRTKL